jgi:hypothetical protein
MDKKTFEALEKIMATFEEQIGHPLEEEVEQVLGWMDEVEKEIDN